MRWGIYKPGHMLYEWAQEQLVTRPTRLDDDDDDDDGLEELDLGNPSITRSVASSKPPPPRPAGERASTPHREPKSQGAVTSNVRKDPAAVSAPTSSTRLVHTSAATASSSCHTTGSSTSTPTTKAAASQCPVVGNRRDEEKQQQQQQVRAPRPGPDHPSASAQQGERPSTLKASSSRAVVTTRTSPAEPHKDAGVKRASPVVTDTQQPPLKRLAPAASSLPLQPGVVRQQPRVEHKPAPSPPRASPTGIVGAGEEEKKQSGAVVTARPEGRQVGAMTLSTALRDDEIADLRRFHDSSLAINTRKAYLSDYHSFVDFLAQRTPSVPEDEIQRRCTLEHVLAYMNQLCNDGKTIATINRRLSTMKKHIVPWLFSKALTPGSRQEQVGREMDAIVRGMRRTVGAEQRVRGKRPLLIENIIAMCQVAALTTNDDGEVMLNTRCRDVCLLLFLFFSAMRRNEVVQLQWSDLTFDSRGVVVQIRQSKTDKEAKGQTIALSRLEEGPERAAFCPVKALEAWRERSRGVGESPVFRWISKKDEIQWRVLIDQRIVAIIKHYATKIGLDPSCFAAHSTRSGYVTSSSDRGVPISEVMKRTRHKSLSSIAVYMKSDDLFSNSGDGRL